MSHDLRAADQRSAIWAAAIKPIAWRAALVNKLAKHLALIACLLIVAKATGELPIGATAIFLLILVAALLNTAGGSLTRRLALRIRGSP